MEEYLDLIFRRAPILVSGEQLKGFVGNCDLWGADFLRYASRVFSEVLAVGRAGSLVLWEQSGRPFVWLRQKKVSVNDIVTFVSTLPSAGA